MPSEHALPQPGDWVVVEASDTRYAIAQVVSVTAKMAVVRSKAHNKQSHPLSNITTMAGKCPLASGRARGGIGGGWNESDYTPAFGLAHLASSLVGLSPC